MLYYNYTWKVHHVLFALFPAFVGVSASLFFDSWLIHLTRSDWIDLAFHSNCSGDQIVCMPECLTSVACARMHTKNKIPSRAPTCILLRSFCVWVTHGKDEEWVVRALITMHGRVSLVLIVKGRRRYLKQGRWPARVCWSLSCFTLRVWETQCRSSALGTGSPGRRACLPPTEAVWPTCGWCTPAAVPAANWVCLPNRSPRMDRRATRYEGAAIAAARCCPCPSAKACGATSTATCPTRACTLCGRPGENWVRLGVWERCGQPSSSKTWRISWEPMGCHFKSRSPSRLAWGIGKCLPETESASTFNYLDRFFFFSTVAFLGKAVSVIVTLVMFGVLFGLCVSESSRENGKS